MIQIACRKLEVRTIFKSGGTLTNVLKRVKIKIPELKKKGVVYKVPCRDCGASYMYIGETGRSLQKRITEHKYAVKTNNRKNDIAVHARDMEHRSDWDATEILEMEPHYWKRCILEAIWIQKTPMRAHARMHGCRRATWTLNEAWTTHTR
jgi:hypothetical protein